MQILLETAHHVDPLWNVAVGVGVFLTLLVLMGLVHGVGASRPHS